MQSLSEEAQFRLAWLEIPVQGPTSSSTFLVAAMILLQPQTHASSRASPDSADLLRRPEIAIDGW
ncbi:hypothetical protein Trco_006940 [Trichoderma cornu-damae]|uniref:Uncharacterized protein n=1 Tax=Trichoderma cornu-damae TaxID=654480 RepID=A0A9P8QM87_9HYPO|nr:hypothetical protein Trco_006940 [Trichoderma cornu-damae]